MELCLFVVWFVFFIPQPQNVRLVEEVWYQYSECDYGTTLASAVCECCRNEMNVMTTKNLDMITVATSS